MKYAPEEMKKNGVDVIHLATGKELIKATLTDEKTRLAYD